MGDGQFWAGVGGAVLGAFVGGGATLLGSVTVNRRELIRGARVRLHDDLLPELRDAIDRHGVLHAIAEYRGVAGGADWDEVSAATRRAAVLARGSALRHWEGIEAAHEAYLASNERRMSTNVYGDREGEPDADARALVERRIDDFARWVEAKIL